MAYIDWDNSFSVKVKQFDEDHVQLVGYINKLHIALLMKDTAESMKTILAGLTDYTIEHFKREEDLMVANSYPDYFVHKKEHNDLVKKVIEFRKDLESGKTVMSLQLMAFLKDWLLKHIAETDSKYSAFFNGKGIS